jgi:putative hydrolase
VAFPGAGAGGNFFEQVLRDLLNLMGGSTDGGSRVELARTLAQGVAAEGRPEGNVDPSDRIRFEQLAHVAELHVGELTGMAITPTGGALDVAAVGPGAWAWSTVEDWRFLLDAMSAPGAGEEPGNGGDSPGTTGAPGPSNASASPPGPGTAGLGLADLGDLGGLGDLGDPGSGLGPMEPGEGAGDLVARWMATMGPMLAAMQLGSAVGHLARSTLGPYELPIPRPAPRLLVVPANVARFAEDWSLDPDEVRLWVCVREVTTQAVLSRPHVAARLRELLVAVVQGMAEEAAGLFDRLQGIDLTQPEALEGLVGDPSALMNLEPSPARARQAADLMAVVAALLGYVEHVLDLAATRLLGGRGAIAEAWRRRQVDRETSERAAELMLGLDLGPTQIDRGADFVHGVRDRAGDEGLARLWSGPRTLPTPAEVDAPGLWLERIDLDDA